MSSARPALPPIPSHTAFLIAQIRSSLSHLHATSELDSDTFRQIDDLLTKNSNGKSSSNKATSQDLKRADEAEKLGDRNAKIRKLLSDTSLVTTMLDLAMQIAIPSAVLGDVQREAILKLVEMSQDKIAKAVTDPELQQKSMSGALSGVKGAHLGVRRGWNAAGQSVNEIARKREEAKLKAESKRMEKEERKAIKQELKKEREEVIKRRQMAMLNGNDDTLGNLPGDSRVNDIHATKGPNSSSSLDSDVASTILKSQSLAREPSIQPIEGLPLATDMDGEAMVSVTCAQLPALGGVASTTTFSPWPGLLLTSTVVATSDEPTEVYLSGKERGSSVSNEHMGIADTASPDPPPRRVAPPPSNVGTSTDGEGQAKAKNLALPGAGETSGSYNAPRQAVAPSASQPALPSPRPPQPQAPPSLPPLRSSNEAQLRQPAALPNEVIDVTESKQKSWTKRLGL